VTESTRSSNEAGGTGRALAGSPFLWGSLACCVFYGLLFYEVLQSKFVERYFASHPVEYAATIMFLLGLAALAIKAVETARQSRGLTRPLWRPIPRGGQPVSDCEALAARLRELPAGEQRSYLVRRLRDALEHVRRSGSAETIDDELKYLADLDAGRAYADYELVRMFIWAIPILGFLGTVIGIAQAMGNLAPQALEDSLPQVMAGLTVAFDTTKLALGLCIVLFFAQFLVSRAENALLARVDRRVEEELVGRFEQISEGPDGQLAAVRRMVEALLDSTDQLVRRQTELWQASIDAAHRRWTAMTDAAGEQLQAALAGALADNLRVHAREVVAAQQAAEQNNRQNWQRVQDALLQSSERIRELQRAVIQKAEVLGRAAEATNHVVQLERALNENLAALAGAKNFEKTVMSLAATIHLLNARLSDLPADVCNVQLDFDPGNEAGQAA
jgi:biopolymer transport protein ExbB/TolQ